MRDFVRPENPFGEGLSDSITNASVGTLFDCNLADLPFFVHHGVDHHLPFGVLLLEADKHSAVRYSLESASSVE